MRAAAMKGRGPVLVLLHAFPFSSAMWHAELEACGGVARVIAPDLPGFGRSPRQTSPSIQAMAQAVAEWLDTLKVREPVVIGGLSMGGYVAFEFLRQFPERVRGLGLFSTRAAPDTPEGRAARLATIEKLRQEGLEPFATAALPRLLGRMTLASSPGVVEAVLHMIRGNQTGGIADALQAMADRRDATPLLPTIRCPTVVVAGDEDILIPPVGARSMCAAIPGAQLEIVSGAGHLVNLEQPAAFHQSLTRFLTSVVSRRAD